MGRGGYLTPQKVYYYGEFLPNSLSLFSACVHCLMRKFLMGKFLMTKFFDEVLNDEVLNDEVLNEEIS